MRTDNDFSKLAGLAAFGAALVGLLYAIAFVVLRNAGLSALFLMLGGFLSLVALVALFERLGVVDTQAAVLGLILGAASALGAAVHGGYDLANVIHAPGALPDAVNNLPNQVDPRGLLTFATAGLAVLIAGMLMRRERMPASFVALTFVLSVLMIIVYLGRLIVLTPSSPLVLVPAAITGFIVNPLWYLMLGLHLRREVAREAVTARSMA